MSNPLLEGRKGERHLLLGNEAIVRGALEAGVHVVTCYPGTPSSEVPDTFYKMGGNGKRYYMQYSVNEKVAMEVACGAALGGGLPRALRLSAAGEQPDGGGDSSGTDAEANPDEGAEGL